MTDVSILDIEATPETWDLGELEKMILDAYLARDIDLFRSRHSPPDHVKAYQTDVARRLFDGIPEGEAE